LERLKYRQMQLVGKLIAGGWIPSKEG